MPTLPVGNEMRDLEPIDARLKPYHRQAGFTLIEVIAVLVIAALAASTILFRGSSDNSPARLKALAGTIASGLRRSRGHAIRQGREVAARVDLRHNRILWGTEQAPLALQAGVGVTAVTAESERQGRTAAIRFFPNGSSTGGRLRLTGSGAGYDVAVNWLTGRVSVERTN